ncbi:hypothetical protein GQ457_13G006470 [Hibiscus cannabinus]
MSYLNRVWMATSVAVVQGRGENQGQKWRSGVKFLERGQRRVFDGEPSDLRPISAAIGSDLSGMVGNREGQADESIRRVMYLNCWGQFHNPRKQRETEGKGCVEDDKLNYANSKCQKAGDLEINEAKLIQKLQFVQLKLEEEEDEEYSPVDLTSHEIREH